MLDSCQKVFTTLPVKVDSFIQKSSAVECSSLVIKKHVHSVSWASATLGWAASKLRVIAEDVVKV